MFAYCGNIPVNYTDPSGQFFASILDSINTAIAKIGNAISARASAYAGVGGIAVLDGPLPFGDTVALIGALVITAGAIGEGIYRTTQPKSKAKEEEKTKANVVAESREKQYNYWIATI